MKPQEAHNLVNTEINKILESLKIHEETGYVGTTYRCKLQGILSSQEKELEFLESFDWTISKDACIEGKSKTINLGFIEHFDFIKEDQDYKICKIKEIIEALEISNADLKELLK